MTANYLLFAFGLVALGATYDLIRRGLAADAAAQLTEEESARFDEELVAHAKTFDALRERLRDLDEAVSDRLDTCLVNASTRVDRVEQTQNQSTAAVSRLAERIAKLESTPQADLAALQETLRVMREVIQKQGSALTALQALRIGSGRGR